MVLKLATETLLLSVWMWDQRDHVVCEAMTTGPRDDIRVDLPWVLATVHQKVLRILSPMAV